MITYVMHAYLVHAILSPMSVSTAIASKLFRIQCGVIKPPLMSLELPRGHAISCVETTHIGELCLKMLPKCHQQNAQKLGDQHKQWLSRVREQRKQEMN